TLLMALCNSGTGYAQVANGFTSPLNQLVPHTRRRTHTMIQGRSDAQTCALVGLAVPMAGRGAMVAADSSRVRKAGDSQSSLGCHTWRKPIRHAIETSDAPMSTIHGLMKFEIRNCGTAKDTPHTRIAGQTSFMPRHPANAQISQNGTISEKNGNWRPTIAPSRKGSIPVTLDSPAIGVPSAP